MKNLLKQAVFAAAVAAAPATEGCRIAQFPDYPARIEHRTHGPAESSTSEKSLQELLALCRQQNKEVSECLQENDELSIKMVHRHLADLPALEDGKIPEEWTQTREKALQRIKMEETVFHSMSGIKVELNEQQNITAIHVDDNKHFIFEKPLPVEFFPLAENEIIKFIEILSDHATLKFPATFKMHGVNLIEFEATGDNGQKFFFGYLPVPDHFLGELKQNQTGTGLQALGPLPVSFNQKQQLEVTDKFKNEINKIFAFASPVLKITRFFSADNREEKEYTYSMPDGTTILTLNARSKSGVIKQYYDAQGERELHPDRWTPIRVTVESDFYKVFDLNDNGKIITIRTEDPDGHRKSVFVDSATEKPYYEKELEQDSGRLIAEDGSKIGSYHQEKKQNPNLTADGYLNRLAKYVTSPAQWLGLTNLMHIVKPKKDFNGLNDDEKAQWIKERQGQWWQSVQQGIEQRDFAADSIDYALLGQEILKRQGINSQVVYLPYDEYGYLAVWITKRPDNNFDVNYYNGELGKNGIFYSAETAENFRVTKGFKNVQEIASAACKILGSEKIKERYSVNCANQEQINFFLQFWDGEIPVLQLPIQNERETTKVPFEKLFN